VALRWKSLFFLSLPIITLTLLVEIVASAQGFYYMWKWIKAKESAGIEKTDRGFELFYWNLSNRRKFIRTMWMIPVCIAVTIFIVFFYMKYREKSPYISLILLAGTLLNDAIWLPGQLIYTYKKWKNEERQEGLIS
jgi:hypothetical protein